MGTSLPTTRPVSALRDHPHACGDKRVSFRIHKNCSGSSPRVWGQVLEVKDIVKYIRIIPTRVGTSKHNEKFAVLVRDHPHACGDKWKLTENCYRSRGSSPRVWGQEELKPLSTGFIRIIPTRVGTSGYSHNNSRLNKDHPHACGDKSYTTTICEHPIGSSPRVWGQVSIDVLRLAPYRIIPTRVGTRSLQDFYNVVNKDHPHACGDKPVSDIATKSRGGSSPRVWGQGSLKLYGQMRKGIIPTRVGTSVEPLFRHTVK